MKKMQPKAVEWSDSLKFDFDRYVDRKNINSLKWDVAENELPMWVADMDFEAAPCIIEALKKRVLAGTFGYSVIPEAWYEAYQGWWSKRHGFDIKKEWLVFCTGVIPAVSCAVKRMTNTGDNIVVQTPVYDIFFHSIENHGRHVLENPLKYEDGNYYIDFEDLEKKLAHPLTTMMILCSPHNPAGRIWSKEELQRIGELCAKYDVLVLSDEIHCDLTDPGKTYTPFASVSEICRDNSITCIAASKAFNIAGLQSAAVIIPNTGIRNKMERGLNSDEIAEPGSFATESTIAAFTEGGEWLDELREYVYENKQYVKSFMEKELPLLKPVNGDATYLLWVDCSRVTDDTDSLCSHIRQTTGLYITAGGQYRGNGKHFVRINLACPRAAVMDGMQRLKKSISQKQTEIK